MLFICLLFFRLFSGFLKVYSFFEIYKFGLDGLYKLVYRSEAVNWTNHPTWKPLNLQVRLLCGTNYNRVIKIACFRYNSNGNHSLMGKLFIICIFFYRLIQKMI